MSLPAGHIVEHWVAGFGRPCLVEDVEGLQGFEFLFLMDLVPTRTKQKLWEKSILGIGAPQTEFIEVVGPHHFTHVNYLFILFLIADNHLAKKASSINQYHV